MVLRCCAGRLKSLQAGFELGRMCKISARYFQHSFKTAHREGVIEPRRSACSLGRRNKLQGSVELLARLILMLLSCGFEMVPDGSCFPGTSTSLNAKVDVYINSLACLQKYMYKLTGISSHTDT